MIILDELTRQDLIKRCQEMQTTCKAAAGALDMCDDLAKRGVEIDNALVAQVQESLTDIHAEFRPKGA